MGCRVKSPLIRPMVFGAADGVTIVLGLLVSLTGQPHALFRATLGAAVARRDDGGRVAERRGGRVRPCACERRAPRG